MVAMSDLSTLTESAALLQPELVALRRSVHEEPEIGLSCR